MTDGYLLDTSVASLIWDGENPRHPTVRERVDGLGSDLIYVSAITIAEVEYGLLIAPTPATERQAAVRAAMVNYERLAVDHHTAMIYGKIRAGLFDRYASRDSHNRLRQRRSEDLTDKTTSKELGIQENDLWIVSVAVQYDLRFITLDDAVGMHRVVEMADFESMTDFWRL